MVVDSDNSSGNQVPSLSSAGAEISTGIDAELSEQREVLVVQAGRYLLGVFTENVSGVAAGMTPAPLPRAPAPVLGVMAFRGRFLTVIDPLPLLGDPSHASTPAIVLALTGEEQLAIAADASRGAVQLSYREIELTEPGAGPEIVYGTLQRADEQIHILNVSRLFDATMQQQERRRRRF